MLLLRVIFALTLGAALTTAGLAQAEGLKLSGSKKNRTALFASQAALLDGRLAKQYDFSNRLKPNAPKDGAKVETTGLPRYKGNYKGAYLEVAKAAARKHGGDKLTGELLYKTLIDTNFSGKDFFGYTGGDIDYSVDAPFPTRDPRVNIGQVVGGKLTTVARQVAVPKLAKW